LRSVVTKGNAKPNKEIWLKIADQFHQVADFPNFLGAVDGKHIRILCRPSSGSHYCKYKKYFSIVLLGVDDANYCFTAIDVGAYGREGDSNIFKNSNLEEDYSSNHLTCLRTDR
jgi:hypothetical protein